MKKKNNYVTNERLMKPTEWAIEEKIDPCLFAFWKNKLVTKEEFNEIKKQIGL